MYNNQNRGYENIDQNDNVAAAPGEQRTGFMERSFKICKVFGIEVRSNFDFSINYTNYNFFT